MIGFYFFPTPNTRKILICLEEAALDYRLLRVDIIKDDQFQPAFLKIGKNNKVPAILDDAPADGGRLFPCSNRAPSSSLSLRSRAASYLRTSGGASA